ncbi:MAG: CARDB domain-containing protein, partial [Candidatus Thermoplasmatota archaeon]|nr:CARDB domain-containing protein [Candidatus Thermoplasmatota archaeon]
TIENIGDIHAEEVLVVFKVDGVEVDSTWVQLIGVGQAKLTYFTWVATEGEHDFTIEIDPYNDIIEKHDQNNGINNNVVSETVTVGETDLNVLGISGATWGIFALIVLAGVLVIVGIAAITKRIKK